MYKVDAIVRQERLEDVKNALVAQGYEEFTVTDVRGHGTHEGPTACYRGITYEIPFTHQVRIELNVPDQTLGIVIDCIVYAAHTGRAGDGKIFVTPLADVIEISLDRPARVTNEQPTRRPRLASTADSTLSGSW